MCVARKRRLATIMRCEFHCDRYCEYICNSTVAYGGSSRTSACRTLFYHFRTREVACGGLVATSGIFKDSFPDRFDKIIYRCDSVALPDTAIFRILSVSFTGHRTITINQSKRRVAILLVSAMTAQHAALHRIVMFRYVVRGISNVAAGYHDIQPNNEIVDERSIV